MLFVKFINFDFYEKFLQKNLVDLNKLLIFVTLKD